MDRTPAQTARLVGLTTVGGILLLLVVLFVIVRLQGDPTDHLEERQPSPSPSSAGQPR
jgi:hypothetical protein